MSAADDAAAHGAPLTTRRRGTQPRAACSAAEARDSGAAVADFALVAGILTLVFACVLQLALVMHVRNTAIDCAGAGARYAALADLGTADGVARTRSLLARSLGSGYSRDVTGRYVSVHGVRTVEIRVTVPLPVLGLLGPPGVQTLTGHAVADSP
ncbi:TadE family protein [Spelaeicoccus albus]|uniref:TadE-like domain-containing protein n=1 Tax=Spelaeicoccus albus TaxID=1280376 RepID=A0A7Z0D5L5_9MICO|nr:TadE family protein [Spelaeicoccus albus]NYI69264.1 hypothetical protein [Spelaeicoccus albus]